MSATRDTARDGTHGIGGEDDADLSELQLGHARIVLEHGPAGVLARIERVDGTDYAGPLPDETIEALREVNNGRR